MSHEKSAEFASLEIAEGEISSAKAAGTTEKRPMATATTQLTIDFLFNIIPALV
ncbi:hypothetical protein [Brevibacillus formosus]|uniref:hypothetical protein n=1 Tax=Brevibacillus formosus TaxID=54913 RepID=UPI003D23F62C